MTPTEEVRAAIDKFEGVTWSNHGDPEPSDDADDYAIGWVKFGIAKSEMGWRTLEFLAWAFMEDLKRADVPLQLFPIAPPPYLNDPGDCLSFVVEMLDDPDDVTEGRGIAFIAKFLNDVRDQYWAECKPRSSLFRR